MARYATTISFSSGSKISGPLLAMTGVIRPKTPKGAKQMMPCIILMHTSLMLFTRSATGWAFLPAAIMPKPKTRAITITCSIVASAIG